MKYAEGSNLGVGGGLVEDMVECVVSGLGSLDIGGERQYVTMSLRPWIGKNGQNGQ